MADTRASGGLTVEQWDEKFFTEYLTENRFAGEMGTSENDIIQVKENLTKKPGDRVNYALVNKLTKAAVLGSNTLEGNEEDMSTRSYELAVNKRRNGVRVAEIEEQFSAISLRNAARTVLKEWSLKDTETLIIEALASIGGLNYGVASAAQRNAWQVANSDRVLYGASVPLTGVHATDLGQLDTTADLLTAKAVTTMKYKALVTANPKIRPIRSAENGRHYYILYVDPRAFRDLKSEANSPIVAAQRETVKEVENNRLFQGGDLLWDGVIIKEVHEMYSVLGSAGGLNTAGTTGTLPVACAFLCGAQALGTAYAKRWTSQTEIFDYGDKHGCAIESIYGVGKLQFGTQDSNPFVPGDDRLGSMKDHGVVTGFFAVTP